MLPNTVPASYIPNHIKHDVTIEITWLKDPNVEVQLPLPNKALYHYGNGVLIKCDSKCTCYEIDDHLKKYIANDIIKLINKYKQLETMVYEITFKEKGLGFNVLKKWNKNIIYHND